MNVELIKRILFTLLLLVLYRVGTLVVAPGLPAEDMYRMFVDADLNYGETFRRFTIFGAGITPYAGMTALVLILAAISKKLRSLLVGEPAQLYRLERIIIIITVVMLIVSAFRH